MNDAKYLSSGFRAMVKSDLQGGTVTISGKDYPATIGTFVMQDTLVAGGISPHMIGDAQVLEDDLPDGYKLMLGQAITVTPTTGKVRQCKVHAVQSAGNMVSIMLWDINQGA